MTTEIGRWLAGLVLVSAGWMATLMLVVRLGGEAPAVLVLFPPDGLIAALPDGVAVVGIGSMSVTLAGGEGLVGVLADLGAVLILPAGLEGCLPQELSTQDSLGGASKTKGLAADVYPLSTIPGA